MNVAIKVTGTYMGQQFTGAMTEFTASEDLHSFVAFTVRLDQPITVRMIGTISEFPVQYKYGELDSIRKITVNLA